MANRRNAASGPFHWLQCCGRIRGPDVSRRGEEVKSLVASMFVATLLAVTSLVFVPGASARNDGNSCHAFAYHTPVFDTPAPGNASDNSELHHCD
jgi:hypothetical protein